MISENIQNLFENVLNWIYPPACVSCGRPGALICDECLSSLPEVGKHYCTICGKPLEKKRFCVLCSSSDFRFTASRAPYLYDGPISAMIKSLKYGGTLKFVPILTNLLTDFWKELRWDVDMIIPVPLSRQRQAQRGFNQSELIARKFSNQTGLLCKPGALMKIRDTMQQAALNADERRENLNGAFAAEPTMVEGKRVLLLDDVMTTGSTFAECSAELLDAGAKSVHCISVATTAIHHGKQKMLKAL